MSGPKQSKSKKVRVDQELVKRGLAETLQLAQAKILSGDVVVAEQRVEKAGAVMNPDDPIRLKEKSRYVSRGGDKLAAAIADFQLQDEFKDRTVLDVGSSTGGFTDCCLQHGASRVIAVDVGTNQLAWSLRNDPRVESHEKTDIREFSLSAPAEIHWVVADVSFTSLARLIPAIINLAPRARLLLLVKPQFELARHHIPTGGVVESDSDRRLALEQVEAAVREAGLVLEGKKDARVEGRAGNREIFILCGLGRV